VFKIVTKPIEQYEQEVNARLAPEIADKQTERDILAARAEKAKKEAVNGKDPLTRQEAEQEAGELSQSLAEFHVPVPLRLMTDDCTPERLASLLDEQGGRLAVLSAEGDVFGMMAGRYSENESKLNVYLKGYSGDTLIVDRQRRTEYGTALALTIPCPALTIGVTVQPDVLRGLAAKPEFRGRGLLGRFLYALPASNLGYRDTNAPPLDAQAVADYGALLRRLLDIKPIEEADGHKRPHDLRLSPEAQHTFDALCAGVEIAMRTGNDLGHMTDWAGKFCGQVARIAGILHLAETQDVSLPVSEAVMKAAITIGRYLIAHAKAAYCEIGTDRAFDDARILTEWIKRKNLTEFSRRDAITDLPTRFRRAEDLDRPLAILMERDFVRERQTERQSVRGRTPAPRYAVNPCFLNPEIIQQIQQKPLLMTITPSQAAYAQAVAEQRKTMHDGRRKPEEERGEEGNASRDYAGALSEQLTQDYLSANGIKFQAAPDVAERTPDDPDLTLLPSGVTLDVKSSRPGYDGLAVNCASLAKSKAAYIWPVLFVSKEQMILCVPVSRAEVETWQVCTGSGGSTFFYISRNALTPLGDAEPLRRLASVAEETTSLSEDDLTEPLTERLEDTEQCRPDPPSGAAEADADDWKEVF
jgi:hypothetical protein